MLIFKCRFLLKLMTGLTRQIPSGTQNLPFMALVLLLILTWSVITIWIALRAQELKKEDG